MGEVALQESASGASFEIFNGTGSSPSVPVRTVTCRNSTALAKDVNASKMTRTAFGLKLRIVGANPRAAVHSGLGVPGLTVAVFAISAGLAGLAGAVDIIGVQSNVCADWNPAYGLAVIPAVFLARMNGFAAIGFVFLLSVLSIGGESAARRLGVPNHFTLVLVSIVLIVLALAEYFDHRYNQSRKA